MTFTHGRFACCAGLLVAVTGLLSGCQQEAQTLPYLVKVMDQYHDKYDVYTDADAAGNHFVARGRMPASATDDTLPPMTEDCTTRPHSGVTCIEATLPAREDNWGGWYFLNGVLTGDQTAPVPEWGTCEGKGVDLTCVSRLTFWARGARGGERVEFVFGGVGPTQPCPDSCATLSTGYVTLSQQWTPFSIDLRGKNLQSIRGGFAWVSSTDQNNGQDVQFYLDDIQLDKARLAEPRFLVSYEAIQAGEPDRITMNAAFVYDNALATLYFLACGDLSRARLLAEAIVYALKNDRSYSDGRLRNAYQGGDLVLFPGWTPHGKENTVRMPGRYDSSLTHWFEDEFQVSTHTGNVAWAMIALISCYRYTGEPRYRDAAIAMGEWVEANCRDEAWPAGYTAGFEGWEPDESRPDEPLKLAYKSTEHNLDLYVAFRRLYLITEQDDWNERALLAKSFVEAMWDQDEGKFWTGTKQENSQIVINKDVIPMDIQAWAVLAMPEDVGQYGRALEYAEANHKVGDGYDFNTDKDGIWFEGTAQMAAAYRAVGEDARSDAIIGFVSSQQRSDGGIYAADHDGLTTGLDLPNRNLDPETAHPWLYYHRVHVGATAWFELAARGLNPFWLGE